MSVHDFHSNQRGRGRLAGRSLNRSVAAGPARTPRCANACSFFSYYWSRFSTESSPAAPALFFFALSTSLFSSLQPPLFFFCLPETLMLALPSSRAGNPQQFRHEIPRAFDPVLADFLLNSSRFPVPFSFPARRRRAAGGGRRAAGGHRRQAPKG
jgi:hypothetical protein